MSAQWPLGPFDREPRYVTPRETDDLSAQTPGTRAWTDWKHARMLDALAGVELGEYDRRILYWLLTWEHSTLAVIAGWIKRARQDGCDPSSRCPGCDSRGLDVRQETNGDLVCHRCGRVTAYAPWEERP